MHAHLQNRFARGKLGGSAYLQHSRSQGVGLVDGGQERAVGEGCRKVEELLHDIARMLVHIGERLAGLVAVVEHGYVELHAARRIDALDFDLERVLLRAIAAAAAIAARGVELACPGAHVVLGIEVGKA